MIYIYIYIIYICCCVGRWCTVDTTAIENSHDPLLSSYVWCIHWVVPPPSNSGK